MIRREVVCAGFVRRAAKSAVRDVHATVLHLLGIDHTRLFYRHNGIDRRLTDVHGQVIDDVVRNSAGKRG